MNLPSIFSILKSLNFNILYAIKLSLPSTLINHQPKINIQEESKDDRDPPLKISLPSTST